MTITEINALAPAEFAARFADVAEHSPWVAETAAHRRPFADREAMIAAFEAVVREADAEAQLALIRAHPDLAGRAAIAGELAEASRREQRGAGLDQLSPAEFARFTNLNALYRTRFGFPFILAVKGATKEQILGAFDVRVHADAASERMTALSQIARIIRFRLEDAVSD